MTGTFAVYTSYCFALGIFVVAYWPALPGAIATSLLLVLGGASFLYRFRSLAWLLWGMCFAIYWGHSSLSSQLPDSLTPSDHLVTGVIQGMPVNDGHRQRFNLKILESTSSPELRRIRISWYQPQVELQPGQVWKLLVRLRRPRGNINPGVFDYQAWLMRNDISATGYVRESPQNRLLHTVGSIDSLRYRLREAILSSPLSEQSRGLIIALTLGDRSLISATAWQRLTQFGLVHLLVVSGLHIGLVAAIGYWVGSTLVRAVMVFGVTANSVYGGAMMALLFAMGYSLLAGFSLPTQRALAMISVAIGGVLLNRHLSKSNGFGLALAGVAVIDPLAVLSAGFWLSFGAVAGLLWLVPWAANLSWGWRALRVQWLVFLVLWLPLVFWQLPIAWLSPLVNLLVIPWIGFLVVPVCLMGTVISLLSRDMAFHLWVVAGWQLDQLMTLLGGISIPRWLPLYPLWPTTLISACLLAVLALLLLLPRGLPGRWLIVPLMVALFFFPNNNPDPLSLTVLDVGQGLSVVVRTRMHTLVYDAGPAHGKQFDTGTAVVTPYLRRQGITGVDRLIISHGDNDHAGGASGLNSLIPASDVLVGDTQSDYDMPVRPCRAGESWRWDGVDFEVLHPSQRSQDSDGNNRSCVLLVRYGTEQILLTGDIETSAERQLLASNKDLAGPIRVLLAPHHGSQTSSSQRFVTALSPQHVVFSAGYRHHYGHPAEAVQERYRVAGATLWNTAEQGALQFSWSTTGNIEVTTGRADRRRYWY